MEDCSLRPAKRVRVSVLREMYSLLAACRFGARKKSVSDRQEISCARQDSTPVRTSHLTVILLEALDFIGASGLLFALFLTPAAIVSMQCHAIFDIIAPAVTLP
jgi:hypothetical protein